MAAFELRQDQWGAFQKAASENFVERLVTHFRTLSGEKLADIDDSELRLMIANGVARAHGHGLTWESAIAAYVQLMFQVAPNFDEHPAFLRVLDDRSLDENGRMQAIFKRVSREEWKEAQDLHDDDAWDQATRYP